MAIQNETTFKCDNPNCANMDCVGAIDNDFDKVLKENEWIRIGKLTFCPSCKSTAVAWADILNNGNKN